MGIRYYRWMVLLQMHLMLAFAAVVVTVGVRGLRWWVGVLIFAGLEAVVMGSLRMRKRQLRVEADRFHQELAALSVAEARRQVYAGLESGEISAIASNRIVPAGEIPADVAALFSRYEEIRPSFGETLRLGAVRDGFLAVGTHCDGGEIVVRCADGFVFESLLEGVHGIV